MTIAASGLVRAGTSEEIQRLGRKVIQIGRAPVLVLFHEGSFYALDNRCPHMGFPLAQGDVHDGLLDCHWHHARFDLSCGATLDPWADDVETYRVVVENGEVFVDPKRPPRDALSHGTKRLRSGLERNLRLVVAKAVIELTSGGVPPPEVFQVPARYGALENVQGWQTGLSILSGVANVLPALDEADRGHALVHACARIAEESSGQPPRRLLPALESSGEASSRSRTGLKAWLRETIEVRDAQGAERVLATLARAHGSAAALDAVLAACSDHRYSDGGHTLDYALKCAELAERFPADPELVSALFTSLVPQLAQMQRMEETSAWRRPVDVAALVAAAEPELERAWPKDLTDSRTGSRALQPSEEQALAELVLAVDPSRTIEALLMQLARGSSPVALAEAVVLAATQRVLAFGSVNEIGDWDTVHHTFTYANAVAEGLRRAPSRELFRAVLDGAMSVYLDRFLNVPPARLMEPEPTQPPEALLEKLLASYDGRSQVDEATSLAWSFIGNGGDPRRLLATLGTAVLREDAGFHDFQELEIAWRRLERRGDSPAAHLALTACARFIAARFPTPRANEQTFDIARRLQRGEKLHEESS